MCSRPASVLCAALAIPALIAAIVLLWRFSACGLSGLVAICCVTLATSLMSASVAASVCTAGTAELNAASISRYELELTSDMGPTTSGFRGLCRVFRDGDALGEAYLVTEEPYDRGVRIRCVGRFSAPDTGDRGRALLAEGILGSIRAVRVIGVPKTNMPLSVIETLRTTVLRTLEPSASEESALIAALALGWRSDFRAFNLQDLFAICGISHIAAVSGTHVTVVCALVAAVLARMRASPRLRVALLVATTALFVVLSGASASSVRAWLMCVSACGAELAGRRADSMSAVSVCGLTLALLRPGLSGNVSFLLSLSCVCGICLFASYGRYVIEVLVGAVRFPSWVSGGLRMAGMRGISGFAHGIAVSVVAALAALPITTSTFGCLSLIGPVVNALLCLPFTLLVTLSVASVAVSWFPALQNLVLLVARFLATVLIALLRLLARIPGASVSLEFNGLASLAVMVGAVAMLYVVWPDVNRRMALSACALFVVMAALVYVRWRFFAPARVCVLDVGQGDAILIQEGSAGVLVDTGPDDAVVRELSKLNVKHLDAVILTHLHDDHCGGLSELYGHIACDGVYIAAGAEGNLSVELADSIDEMTGAPARILSQGDVLHVSNFAIEALWPTEPAPGTGNEDSLVMGVSYENAGKSLTALLTGDAEHEVLDACSKLGLLHDIDFLKVGHHGSEVSLTAENVGLLKPELAVASAGWNNSYGHPSETCVKTLEEAGAVFLCTKDVGTVIVEPGQGHLTVHETGASHEVE